jgi:hypothetical protein
MVAGGRVAGVVEGVVEAGALVLVLGVAGVEGWKGKMVGEGVMENGRREEGEEEEVEGGRPGMVLVDRKGHQQEEEAVEEGGAPLGMVVEMVVAEGKVDSGETMVVEGETSEGWGL